MHASMHVDKKLRCAIAVIIGASDWRRLAVIACRRQKGARLHAGDEVGLRVERHVAGAEAGRRHHALAQALRSNPNPQSSWLRCNLIS